MNGRSTISDVAKRVGVSKTTVSHALSGKRRISGVMKERIFDAIAELDYRPSPLAKGVAGARMMLVAALVDSLCQPTTGTLLELFQREFERLGYGMAVFTCGDSQERAVETMKYLSSGLVDGILNLLPGVTVNQALSCCAPVPAMTYLRPHIDSPVYIDIPSGMKAAAEYLLSLGHRRIAFVGGSKIKAVDMLADPQVEGVRMALEPLGAWDPDLVAISSDGRFEDGVAFAGRLVEKGATAIMAGNDMIAAGVLSWASRAGLRVPGDLSVLGYDDSQTATMVTPALTSVQVPFQEIALATASALIDRIDGASILQHRVLSLKLVIRDSCSPLQRKGATKKSLKQGGI